MTDLKVMVMMVAMHGMMRVVVMMMMLMVMKSALRAGSLWVGG